MKITIHGFCQILLGMIGLLLSAGSMAGEWTRLPGSITEVAATSAELGVFNGYSGARGVPMWSGAAYGDHSFWLWGGGHSDSGDNSIYRYDLRTFKWKRYGPWTAYTVSNGCYVPTAAPISSHSADGLWWANGRLWVSGYAGYCIGMGSIGPSGPVWSFDPVTQLWQSHVTFPGVEPHTAYNAAQKKLYYWSRRSKLITYNSETLSKLQTLSGPLDYVLDYTSLDWDSENRILYGLSNNNTLYIFDVKTDGLLKNTWRKVTGMPWSGVGMAVRKGLLYFWDGTSTVRRYDPVASTWTTFADTGGPTREYNRIWSKWQYVPQLDAFIGFSSFNSVYMWRPDDSKPPSEIEWTFDPYTYGGLPRYEDTSIALKVPALTGSVGLTTAMGTTGERSDLGLVTEWTAALLAGRLPFKPVVQAQGGLIKWDGSNTMFKLSAAHAPNVEWPAYLLTGDPQYIQQMRDQWRWYQVKYRGRKIDGPIDAIQQRELAWQLRNLAQLAKVDPFYRTPLEKTRLKFVKLMATCAAGQTNSAFFDSNANPGRCTAHNLGTETHEGNIGFTPWQQTFITQVLAHVVLLGFEEWRPILEWHFSLWRELAQRSMRHMDAGDIAYSRTTTTGWDDILAFNGGASQTLVKNDEVREMRGNMVNAALALAATAKVPDACKIYQQYRAAIKARQTIPLTLRWNPVPECI